MKMLGRLVGSGHCTCWDCGMPRGRKYQRIRKRREQRTWKREVEASKNLKKALD